MGEKPGRGRGREKATSQGRALHATMQRVKVYRLEDNGKWKGQGMGHVTIDYMEGSNELVLAVLDAWDNDILLLHNITPDDIYRKHETIISWRDPEKGLELALSFEGPVECSDTWENMCNIREDLQSEILRHKSSSVNDELKELRPLELFSSKRKKYSQPLPLELSSLLTTLKNIEKMLQRGMTAKTRVTDSISKYVWILREGSESHRRPEWEVKHQANLKPTFVQHYNRHDIGTNVAESWILNPPDRVSEDGEDHEWDSSDDSVVADSEEQEIISLEGYKKHYHYYGIDLLGYHPHREIAFLGNSFNGFAYYLDSSKLQYLGSLFPQFSLSSRPSWAPVFESFIYTPCMKDLLPAHHDM